MTQDKMAEVLQRVYIYKHKCSKKDMYKHFAQCMIDLPKASELYNDTGFKSNQLYYKRLCTLIKKASENKLQLGTLSAKEKKWYLKEGLDEVRKFVPGVRINKKV